MGSKRTIVEEDLALASPNQVAFQMLPVSVALGHNRFVLTGEVFSC